MKKGDSAPHDRFSPVPDDIKNICVAKFTHTHAHCLCLSRVSPPCALFLCARINPSPVAAEIHIFAHGNALRKVKCQCGTSLALGGTIWHYVPCHPLFPASPNPFQLSPTSLSPCTLSLLPSLPSSLHPAASLLSKSESKMINVEIMIIIIIICIDLQFSM